MQVIKVNKNFLDEIPWDFTGIVETVSELGVEAKIWILAGRLRHRVDGPAIERSDGYKSWWLYGDRHRDDGPAIERVDGSKDWWLNGEILFDLYKSFVFIEELKHGKEIKVLTQEGIEIWPDLPGLKELADNWEKK